MSISLYLAYAFIQAVLLIRHDKIVDGAFTICISLMIIAPLVSIVVGCILFYRGFMWLVTFKND